MLVVGLPLAIVAGAASAWWLFPELGLWQAALLGAMLAATDAALSGSILDDERIPEKIRTSLTVESGLNDGLALPFVLLFASLAGARFERPASSPSSPSAPSAASWCRRCYRGSAGATSPSPCWP
jgi:NhaP-type Na+/H+ or K+/H+ antiporter